MKTEADYLKKLVSFKTVSAEPANFSEMNKCAEYIAQFYRDKNYFVVEESSNGFPSVYASPLNTKNPRVLLQAHLDVVPAGNDLFNMRDTSDKLIGRGVFDMKFAAACFMKLADELDNQKPDYGVMVTFDEEIGGFDGVEYMLGKGYSCDVVVIPDGGLDWTLETSAKGAWFIDIKKKGKSAHGSVPHEGVNAAQKLVESLHRIIKLQENYDPRDLTITLSKLNSGKAANQIPDFAVATFDIRYKTKDLLKQLTDQIKTIAHNDGLVIETQAFGECIEGKTEHPQVKKFVNVAEKILDRKIKKGHSSGSTDARFFDANNIPCIVIQPGGGGRHAENEWIDKKDLAVFTSVLKNFILNQ